MVLTLMIPVREVLRHRRFRHHAPPQQHGKLTLTTGMVVAYGYMMEAFYGWYSSNTYEYFMIRNRMLGPYAPFYWIADPLQHHHAAVPVVKSIRTNPADSLDHLDHRQYRHVAGTFRHRRHESAPRLPALSWGMYWPTIWDWAVIPARSASS